MKIYFLKMVFVTINMKTLTRRLHRVSGQAQGPVPTNCAGVGTTPRGCPISIPDQEKRAAMACGLDGK